MKIALAHFWQILGTTVTLLVLTVVAAHLLVSPYASAFHGRSYDSLSAPERAAYGPMKREDIDDLLYWTFYPGWVYEAWTGFHETPRRSRFVNVNEHGIRATAGSPGELAQLDWSRTLLMFGGSTTFG